MPFLTKRLTDPHFPLSAERSGALGRVLLRLKKKIGMAELRNSVERYLTSPVAGRHRRSSVAGRHRRSPIAGRRSPIAGRRSPVAGRRSPIAGKKISPAACTVHSYTTLLTLHYYDLLLNMYLKGFRVFEISVMIQIAVFSISKGFSGFRF